MLFLLRLHSHLRHLLRATEHVSLEDRNYRQVCLGPKFFLNSCILRIRTRKELEQRRIRTRKQILKIIITVEERGGRKGEKEKERTM